MIQTFGLKKVCENSKFQEFTNEEKGICLVITGVGSIPAAVAVSCACSQYGIREDDFLVNIGTCASALNSNITSPVLNSITHSAFDITEFSPLTL